MIDKTIDRVIGKHPEVRARRLRVLRAFAEAGEYGCPTRDALTRAGAMNSNGHNDRFGFRYHRLIEICGFVRYPPVNGARRRTVCRWRLTEAGRALLGEMEGTDD